MTTPRRQQLPEHTHPDALQCTLTPHLTGAHYIFSGRQILFPPLAAIEVVSKTYRGDTLCIDARISCNSKAETIEKVIEKRTKMLEDMIRGMVTDQAPKRGPPSALTSARHACSEGPGCAPAAPRLRPDCAPAAPRLRPDCAPTAPRLRPYVLQELELSRDVQNMLKVELPELDGHMYAKISEEAFCDLVKHAPLLVDRSRRSLTETLQESLFYNETSRKGAGDRRFGEAVQHALRMKEAAVKHSMELFRLLAQLRDARLPPLRLDLSNTDLSGSATDYPVRIHVLALCFRRLVDAESSAAPAQDERLSLHRVASDVVTIDVRSTCLDDVGAAMLINHLNGTRVQSLCLAGNPLEAPAQHPKQTQGASSDRPGPLQAAARTLDALKQHRIKDASSHQALQLVESAKALDALTITQLFRPSLLNIELGKHARVCKLCITTVLPIAPLASAAKAPLRADSEACGLIKVLGLALGRPELTELIASHNRLGNQHAAELKTLWPTPNRSHLNLTLLDLSFNRLGARGCSAIVSAITGAGAPQQPLQLERLNLGGNYIGCSGDVNEFVDAMKSMLASGSAPALSHLRLFFNCLKEAHINMLRECVRQRNTDQQDGDGAGQIKTLTPDFSSQGSVESVHEIFPREQGTLNRQGTSAKAARSGRTNGAVICVGAINVDINVSVKSMVAEDHAVQKAEKIAESCGGKALNTAVAAGLLCNRCELAAKVYLVGCTGNDSSAGLIKSFFEKVQHVSIEYMNDRKSNQQTGVACLLNTEEAVNVNAVGGGSQHLSDLVDARSAVEVKKWHMQVEGANADLDCGHVVNAIDELCCRHSQGVLCIQQEISDLSVNLIALEDAHHRGMHTIMRMHDLKRSDTPLMLDAALPLVDTVCATIRVIKQCVSLRVPDAGRKQLDLYKANVRDCEAVRRKRETRELCVRMNDALVEAGGDPNGVFEAKRACQLIAETLEIQLARMEHLDFNKDGFVAISEIAGLAQRLSEDADRDGSDRVGDSTIASSLRRHFTERLSDAACERLHDFVRHGQALIDRGTSCVVFVLDKDGGVTSEARSDRQFHGIVVVSCVALKLPAKLRDSWADPIFCGGTCALYPSLDGKPDRVMLLEIAPTGLYPTGLVDAFIGSLAVLLADGVGFEKALAPASHLAALSMKHDGAAVSYVNMYADANSTITEVLGKLLRDVDDDDNDADGNLASHSGSTP